ncbi:Vesicle transport protein USE1 [Holothuria leucospilota]|uniref:Vesicle transport protein USE1 n=1 Tax=Holothuria leucospilota TaxID=206669 RepID=A0A9Q1BNX8_HOLLE|nr:Vesicle transport protein USE1 [Holothuria leucospilota]
MPSSRLEINFQRLLSRCETMAGEKSKGGWRLEKYVCALQGMLDDLKKSNTKPGLEAMQTYEKKVAYLKSFIQAEKLPSTTERAHQHELNAPARTISLPDSRVTGPLSSSRQLHQITTARYHKDMRRELLGEDDDFSSGELRHRGLINDHSTTEDLDAVLQHHRNLQEKLAEEMLSLTRNLKHNTVVASNIIKKDNMRLEETNRLADSNYSKLKVESDRLEVHAKRSCNWWIWGTVVFVSIVFLQMIIFIKFIPKGS